MHTIYLIMCVLSYYDFLHMYGCSMAQFYPPLKERVIKSKYTCATIDTSTATISRGVYKGWREDNMV